MTIERNLQPPPASAWESLDAGLPTIVALAQLCGRAITQEVQPEPLTVESEALLFAAKTRGVFELKAVQTAFDSADRLLAVYVEQAQDQHLVFRRAGDPQFTLHMLDAFRRLCSAGLVMHQSQREFSLTRAGFERAREIAPEAIADLLEQATQVES